MSKDEKSSCDTNANLGNQSIKPEDTDEYKETEKTIACRAYATVLFRRCDTNNNSEIEAHQNQLIKPEDTDEYKEMDKIITCRTYAAIRLRRNELWLQWISIYYSCFTSALAIISLHEKASFLGFPSAIFTVIVAILVTFANAQKNGSRANDLNVNCNDMRRTLDNFQEALKKGKTKEAHDEYIKFIEELADSEQHYPVDEYKYNNGKINSGKRWCSRVEWYIYLFFYTFLILILIFIPILFVVLYRVQFLALF